MAGPWFAVHECGEGDSGKGDSGKGDSGKGDSGKWQRLDSVWISNGESDCQGHIEIKISLENSNDDS